jgi:predicted dinucleotide-binding enzyme
MRYLSMRRRQPRGEHSPAALSFLSALAKPVRSGRNAQQPPPVAAAMTTVGLIGSGNIGATVARLAVGAGHDVVLSNSRGPATLTDLVAELGPHARAGTPAEAASAGDLVVVTIPLGRMANLPVEELRGRVVIDTMNYYPARDGRIDALEDESTTTSELLQARLPDSFVVKAFNNIFFQHLATLPRPTGVADRSALPIAGDDTEAKGVVGTLLDSIGYDVLDVGRLSEGWRFQRDTAAYGTPYAADPTNWAAGPRPAGVADLQQAVAAARRYRDA